MLFKECLYRKGTLIMVISVLLCGVFFVVQPEAAWKKNELAQRDISQYMDKTNLNAGVSGCSYGKVLGVSQRSPCLAGVTMG